MLAAPGRQSFNSLLVNKESMRLYDPLVKGWLSFPTLTSVNHKLKSFSLTMLTE
jgi:hypothetical protein